MLLLYVDKAISQTFVVTGWAFYRPILSQSHNYLARTHVYNLSLILSVNGLVGFGPIFFVIRSHRNTRYGIDTGVTVL